MPMMFSENDNSTPYAIRKRWGRIKCKCGSNEFDSAETKLGDRRRLICQKCGQGYQIMK
jgi:hypothetical protein